MGTKTTSRQLQAEETRRRILEVAIDAFSQRRYDDVAVGDIAAAAGVAHGLLFHYFKNKRGIYLAAMEEASRGLDEAHQADPRLPAGMQFRRLYRNHFQYLARHEGLVLRLILGGRGADPEAWSLFEEGRWRALEWGCTLLGLDPNNDALRMMLRAATSFADETAVYWHRFGHRFDVELIADVLVDQVIVALRGAARLDSSLDVEDAIALLRASDN